MRTVQGELVCSPTDLVGFLACPHLTNLQRAEQLGLVKRPTREDPELELLMEKGLEHEQRYLASLPSELRVATIPQDDRSEAGLLDARQRTLDAMRHGEDVIYQATFVEHGYSGQADFLRRVDTPSDLGEWSYEPEDTKLALSAKAGAVVQLLAYAQMIEAVQGAPPERIHVILGRSDDPRRTFRVADFAAYHRLATRQHTATVDGPPPTEATVNQVIDPVEHCTVCAWGPHCRTLRSKSGHLSGVAFIRRDEVEKLRAAGVMTMADLALCAPPKKVQGLTDEVLARLQDQAWMQLEEQRTGQRFHKILDHPTEPPLTGLLSLPEPSPRDLYFDFEGDRFAEDGGLEYLFGYVETPAVGVDPAEAPYHAIWAHDRVAEKGALEQFIDLVMERRAADPGMHVYHYAPYEPSALHRLTQRHGTRQAELDVLLRAGVFVDLYRVVRQGVRVSSKSYSIKRLEKLYDLVRDEDGIAKSLSSMIAYERWKAKGDQALLDDIASYNRDDCVSTLLLQGWLEERRVELIERLGVDPGRPTLASGDPAEDQREADAETEAVRAALTADIDPAMPDEDLNDEQLARRLLGGLLAWHRRESRSEWFEWFRLSKLDGDELAKETTPLAVRPGADDAGPEKRSRLWRWRFDPAQESRLHEGDNVVALPLLPRIDKGGAPTGEQDLSDYGVVTAFSQELGEVVVKVGPSKAGRDMNGILGFLPTTPIRTTEQRASLLHLGRWVASHGIAADGESRAVRDVLLRRPPRLLDREVAGPLVARGEVPGVAARAIAASLDDSYLAIQGPPGSGKTHVGAELILDLVRQSRAKGEHRVIGVTAFSHAAVGNLLAKVVELARPGDDVRILQKADDGQRTHAAGVDATDDNALVDEAIAIGDVDVLGGTTWLWSRPKLAGVLDTLLVDEAGQISLANVAAIGRATRNLVLLGDPQQLSQPLKAVHPPGTEKSVLEHVVGPHQAIEPELGILLAQTRRLHPSICRFTSELFYEGKLRPMEGLERQAIGGPDDWLSGTGLRFRAVEHEGRSNASPEEADVVARITRSLLGRAWTNAEGRQAPIEPKDVLVVSPYNTQVAHLRHVLPQGVRAGTVDKFQGQQAPVVLYSMATSTPDDMPRDMGFLFSRNRFNVATSRAQALVVVVCNPALLTAPCRTPEQMRLVNALARYLELATTPS